MDKKSLLGLYGGYLKRNPSRMYVKNLKIEGGKDLEIDSAHLLKNQVLTDEKLPDYMTVGQLRELDSRYRNELKWDIIDSDMTEEQIAAFEKENNIILPVCFREFLQGYSFLQEEFYPKCTASFECCQGIYDEETGKYTPFTDEELDGEELTGNVKFSFTGIRNPCSMKKYKCIRNVGYILIGELENNEFTDQIFLNCETGEVESWSCGRPELEYQSLQEFEDKNVLEPYGFTNFDTFLKWLFGEIVYNFRVMFLEDEEEWEEEEREEEEVTEEAEEAEEADFPIESKGYPIRNLYIVTEKESRSFDDLRADSCTEAVRFIRDAIKKGRLECLEANFGEGDAYYISIYAEKSRSAILIHDDVRRKSYNYKNKKYENDETEVGLAGYYFPQMIVCEDKDILLDIILHYFETGKIHEKYEWFELDD